MVDYTIWEGQQEQVYHGKKLNTTDQLKQVIVQGGVHYQSASLITASVN